MSQQPKSKSGRAKAIARGRIDYADVRRSMAIFHHMWLTDDHIDRFVAGNDELRQSMVEGSFDTGEREEFADIIVKAIVNPAWHWPLNMDRGGWVDRFGEELVAACEREGIRIVDKSERQRLLKSKP